MGARGVLGGAISKIAGNRNLELRLRKTAISAYTHWLAGACTDGRVSTAVVQCAIQRFGTVYPGLSAPTHPRAYVTRDTLAARRADAPE